MASAIDGLEPNRLWEYFAELSAIPRCSKHEARAVAWIYSVAGKLGLDAQQDDLGNVIARKPACPGRESAPMVCLQSHIDMVCEKNRDKVHDFSKDPITLRRDGNFLTADGTTLGADNGMGVCTALALMESASAKHGPLEFLFTIDEETGLTGAANLKSDFVKSRILINLDSEDEGVLYVGCAGGGDTVGELPVAFGPMPAKHVPAKLAISGLRGGHSGIEIHTVCGNAIKLLNRALAALTDMGVRLAKIEGGNKRNAIPREAMAVVAFPAMQVDAVNAKVSELDALFRAELAAVDAGVLLPLEMLKSRKMQVMKKSAQKKLVNLLYAIPHGVIAMSPEIPGLVETSTNLAVIKTTKNAVVIETSQRSSVESEKKDIMQAVGAVFSLAGAEFAYGAGYPGWKPDLQSPILKIAQETYRSMFGKEVEVKAVHAGLECGIIGEKFPGMDMVSLGPTLQMVHSPQERILIDTIKKYWDYLVGILERV